MACVKQESIKGEVVNPSYRPFSYGDMVIQSSKSFLDILHGSNTRALLPCALQGSFCEGFSRMRVI